MVRSIRIPILNSAEYVEIFPDELPSDAIDVVDVLKAEWAPLKIWRAVAVEYYRQGEYQNFELVLSEIVSTIEQDPTVEKHYREKGEYKEGIVEIFDALAAYALTRKSVGDTETKKQEVLDYIRKVDSINQRNEYTWLIKGFYQLAFGNLSTHLDEAEYHLKNVHEMAKNHADRKVYLFGSLLGLGTSAFVRKKYTTALEFFTKALHQNPDCGANVRVAIASCTFKLEQYDRTRAALDRALALDPTNVDALVLLSLVERVESQKAAKKKRIECRAIANELCVLASQIDPTCSMALNHLANFSFYDWKLVHPAVLVSSSKTLIVPSLGTTNLQVGDMIQLRKSFVSTVVSITRNDSEFEVNVETDIPREWIGQSSLLQFKDAAKINEVKTLATRALRAANHPNLKAESFYIFGRLYHMIRDYDIAFQLYEEALNNQADMPLAAFGLGQLFMAKQDYAAALEKFQSVLARYPDDRDTQAYVMLLQSIHKKESTPFDKLREIAPGFAFEADLWLSQGHTLLLKGPGEYATALKCYEMAYECMIKQNLVPQSKMLLNMGILYHSLGNLVLASDYVKRSLSPNLVASEESSQNPTFHRPENDIFYTWSDENNIRLLLVERDSEGNEFDATFQLPSSQLCTLTVSDDSVIRSLSGLISVGDDLFISDVLVEVLDVLDDRLVCKGFSNLISRSCAHPVRIKKVGTNFNQSTLTNCFALARIQEDRGHLQAAREIYLELLKLRPTFIECLLKKFLLPDLNLGYLRLSLMAKEIGKINEATQWVSLALEIDPNHADSIIVHGDLCAIVEKWELAKGKYEKICKQRHHDSRALLSLGNMYYANIAVKESSLKDSMKFYHMVLKEDQRNIYAANGLGMICAAKEQNEIAREIFSRVRETGISPGSDVCVNLGHMHLTQGRYVDATHIYSAAIKALPNTPAVRVQSQSIGDVGDCLALSYLKNSQHEDAIRILLKSLHYDPSRLHDWFNIACVKEEYAVKLCRTHPGSTSDISLAVDELENATVLFRSLKNSGLCPGIKRHEQFHPSKAGQHENFCLDAVEKAKNKLYRAQIEAEKKEQIRSKQAEENRQRLALKQAEKIREEEAKLLSTLKNQELAKQKEREFEELRRSWASTEKKSTDKDKKKGRKTSKQDNSQPEEEDGEDGKSPFPFSDSESETNEKPLDEADVFGSSSDEEKESPEKSKGPSSQLELFDSDEEAQGGNLRRKRPIEDINEDRNEAENLFDDTAEVSASQTKQRRILVDDDDDVEAEADF